MKADIVKGRKEGRKIKFEGKEGKEGSSITLTLVDIKAGGRGR